MYVGTFHFALYIYGDSTMKISGARDGPKGKVRKIRRALWHISEEARRRTETTMYSGCVSMKPVSNMIAVHRRLNVINAVASTTVAYGN